MIRPQTATKEARVIELSQEFTVAAKVLPPSDRIPCPAPGIYPNVPFHTYLKWDAASNSALGQLDRSPAHLKAYLDGGHSKDTPAKQFGRALHSAILEPEDFGKRYVVGPEEKRSNADKQRWIDLELQYGPGRVLRPADFEKCVIMRDGIHAHPNAHQLLAAASDTELSVVWIDEDTGLPCKARFDLVVPHDAIPGLGGTLGDLKSCEDARPDPFSRAMYEFGYFRQGAMYIEGAVANALPIEHYSIIAYEKEPPFALMIYRLDMGTLDAGAQDLRRLMRLYKHCRETGEYPAYDQRVIDLALPPWAWEKVDQKIKGARV